MKQEEMLNLFKELEIFNQEKQRKIAKIHTNELYNRKENESFHNTYFFEQEYYSLVERGDIDALKKFIKNVPQISEGTVASDSLRQAKNLFISSVTLITRHAILGGLDIETAYILSDSYIQEVEKMASVEAITMLHATAAFDFTERVAENKIPVGMSTEIFKVMQYISNHINQNISVEEIANHLQMDRTTLSKKFKRELGEYLCFSTQSYFQNVFKKKYGMTPKEYRNRT